MFNAGGSVSHVVAGVRRRGSSRSCRIDRHSDPLPSGCLRSLVFLLVRCRVGRLKLVPCRRLALDSRSPKAQAAKCEEDQNDWHDQKDVPDLGLFRAFGKALFELRNRRRR